MVARHPEIVFCPVRLYYPTKAAATSTLILRGPNYGHMESVDLRQVIEISAAGEQIVFNRGPTTYRLEASFANLSRTQRDDLETFFVSTVGGAAATFQLTIPRFDTINLSGGISAATLYTGCEFETGVIAFSEETNGMYSTSLTIRASGKSTV